MRQVLQHRKSEVFPKRSLDKGKHIQEPEAENGYQSHFMQRWQWQRPEQWQRHDQNGNIGDDVHDSVAEPKPKPLLTYPAGLLGVPVLGKGKADRNPSDKACNCPHGEKYQGNVAKLLEGRERKDAPELQEESELEKHDGDVVAQGRDKDQLYLVSTCC